MSKYCPRCHAICESCVESTLSCTKCKGNRLSTISRASPAPAILSCTCPDGFFENFKSTNCPQCVHQCSTCVTSATNCLACVGTLHRHPKPSCDCHDGYYDDPLQPECQLCRLVCVTCNAYSNCLSCGGNRVGPDEEGNCPCPLDTLDRENLGIPWCANDTLAIPDIYFSNDLYNLVIDFGYEVTIRDWKTPLVFSEALCEYVLEASSLSLMGDSPKYQCAINKNNHTQFFVKLGANSTVKVGDTIDIVKDVVRFKRFNRYFIEFMLNVVQPARDPFQPEAVLEGPVQNITLCQVAVLNLTTYKYDGLKPLKIVSWKLPTINAITSQSLKTLLTQYMNDAVANNSFVIQIPILTLEPFVEYKFEVEFDNFMAKRGRASYQFITSTNEAPVVAIDKTYPFVFYP